MIGAFAVIITVLTVLSLPAAFADSDRRIIAVAAVYATTMCAASLLSPFIAGLMLFVYGAVLLPAVTAQAIRRRYRRKAQHARAVAEGWETA